MQFKLASLHLTAVEFLQTKQHRLETAGRHLFPRVNPLLAELSRDALTAGAVPIGDWICCTLAQVAAAI
jgi:hypothetical protein